MPMARGPLMSRMKAWMAGVMVVAALSGCTAPGGAAVSSEEPVAHRPSGAHGGADPQILSDVVEASYMVPGPNVRRAMRVKLAIKNTIQTGCGARPIDIDSTYDRFDQAHYADLDLIAQRGLTETESNSVDAEVDESCAKKVFPLSEVWFQSTGQAWYEATQEAVNDPAVIATHAPTAECLSAKIGWTVEQSDPVAYFLANADRHLQQSSDWKEAHDKASRVFVECTGQYFASLRQALLPRRQALVERNRELLQSMADELAAKGYVP